MDTLDGVLEALPDAVLVVDEEGVIQWANRNVRTVLGYSPDSLEGEVVENLLPEEDREHHVQFRHEYMESPEPRPMGRELDLYALHEDGTRVPVEISLGPIERDGDLYVVATISDISNRKQRERELRASEQRYRRLLEVSPAPIVIYDTEGTIIYANEAAADRMNVDSADELVGVSALALVHPDERDAAREKIRQTVAERIPVNQVERTLLTPDGQKRHAILSSTPIEYENRSAVQVVVNDVTELKERERDLQRQNERLDEFASIVSHDLRNPLSVARGYVEQAREECDTDHLDPVVEAHDRMEELIEGLLTLSREGRTVETVESIDLGALVARCWRTVETGEATLVTDAGQTIRADPGSVQRLLENLVRNAVEHGGDTVTVGDLDDGFYVADDGAGIPQEERERIFDVGYSTAHDGTGFGLNIVREVVDAHGWDIAVTESEDGGARFEITGVEVAS